MNKRHNKQEDVIAKIKAIHGDKLDTSKVVYEAMKKKVTLICPVHGEIQMTPNSLIYGKCGCRKCGEVRSELAKLRTFESVLEQAKEVHNNFYSYDKVVDYKSTSEKYTITCPIHGDFQQNFSDHTSGRGCPKCGRKLADSKRRLTQEQAFQRCIDSHGDKYEYPDFNYVNDRTHIKIKCKKHGIFEQQPLNHFRGVGCPMCVGVDSKAEIELRDFLREQIDIIHSDRKAMGNRKELDIFIPSKNIGIEYNGLYYHSNKFQEENYHLEKTEDCLSKGIKLIHIFEDEWRNKKDIVKSRLLNIIGKTPNKVYARNCEIKEVETKTAMSFLEANHLQGKLGSQIRLGLFYNEELVSLMTFGSLRKNLGSSKKEGVYELLRFCNKLNTNVVGGASKLYKYFESNYDYEEVISYADRRWSQGDLYVALNFEKVSESKPNYFYVKGDVREARFKYRKDILVSQGHDKEKTEKQIMKEMGYNRIYDCGALKFKKTKNQNE